ncbi:DUF3489 domain-containing protein [Belnapia sp. T18]|uniref:DUF3489 domain-containing protein n=2 Tax=Belnapia arida TaxID=2804533 RepID=A0ABS1UC87_9PROT|nr:DUF3489 domain-containing protein [Belnapia arida]MBL6081564.1 DUF3489 domain-containing protein [Belnapia arida]
MGRLGSPRGPPARCGRRFARRLRWRAHPTAARSGQPRQPREGTKQQQVLAMLRRPEGATVAQIVDATGWQAHTARGFFAGLQKCQRIAVEAAKRVRARRAPRAATPSTASWRRADAAEAARRCQAGGRALPGLRRRAGSERLWGGSAAGQYQGLC